ncbi:hypothetical protein V502_07009 [Pseudogymnoascus sp. VKM F-4520 (FW-2644)]|nr:hypothetical protein V502_07009 [Pseudogymnoascus sp. VKM F-4520 (FW-2644)]
MRLCGWVYMAIYSWGGSFCVYITPHSPVIGFSTTTTYYIFETTTSPVSVQKYESIMDIFYDISVENEQGIHTKRLPLSAIRWFFMNAPSDFALAGIVVNALNHIALDPVGVITVTEISIFFTTLGQYWLDWLASSDDLRCMLTLNQEVQVTAVVQMPPIPGNVPLSRDNQYIYFCDYRHPKTLSGRWKAIKAEYLAQNPHMTGSRAQARRIYEIRRQMAHDLGWVDKETFHLFETPPSISEDFRPVILRPPWKMLFMTNPGMELPILPLFRQQRATRASSAPRPDPASELRIMFEPTFQCLQNRATGLHLETAGPSTEPPANADLGSGASTAESGSTVV